MMPFLYVWCFLLCTADVQADLGHAYAWLEQQEKEHGLKRSLESFPKYQEILRSMNQKDVSEVDLLDLLGLYSQEIPF